ncbi:hypothetical protein BGZ80_009611 [Entomortierella chlamydospora]|uniref:Uncharacterized protein n=1 Tax=Entomortierella chlamydospora TaxID=101097 RepID=A0A9P6MXC5_9FUNG|nr:hypothetical protein BGZ80_009611 [Entomortierella chlamydospora]
MGLASLSDEIQNSERYKNGVLSEIVTAGIKLRELVAIGRAVYFEDISRAVHAFESTLEILIVSGNFYYIDFQSPRFKYEHGFPKLTRLETGFKENQAIIQLPHSKLDHRLTHLGTIQDRRTLANIANLKALRSVTINGVNAGDLLPLWESFPENGGSSQIECLSLNYIEGYEPKRIGYYPNDIIDVITTNGCSPPGNFGIDTGYFKAHDNGILGQHLAQDSIHDPSFNQSPSISRAIASPSSPLSLSMSPMAFEPCASNHSPGASSVSFSSSHSRDQSQSHITLRSSSSTSSISSLLTRNSSGNKDNLTQLRGELANYADIQSAQLFQLVQQQAEAKERELEMLRMLVEAKACENEILRKQVESEERDKQHREMLQQSIDRLAILQRGVDAVLVQNYELHEYSIPRLFIILPEKIASKVIRDIENPSEDPESFSDLRERIEDPEGFTGTVKSLDPRNFFEDRFRLYFLCECGDDSSTESGMEISPANASTQPVTNIKNKVHLAKHEGYQLSRPTQFLKQYGPYILGMLQILKFCLDAAKIVAPAVGIAQEGLKKAADSVKTTSMHTLEAVNISINFLEERLGGDNNLDSLDGNSIGDDIFKDLAALEGADLRQLETFLRNKDKDKILGNLYRTTTSDGHVKWVCLEHFKTSYRENAMKSLLNTIKVNRGSYDKQLRKITMALPSSVVTKEFMKQLITYSFAVDELDLTLDYGFGTADLTGIVKSLAQSNVRVLKLDLKDKEGLGRVDIKILGTAKYRPLLELMSNRKLQQLSLTGIDYFGSRTSDLSKNHAQSRLRSFHHLDYIRASDIPRLVNILSFCKNLVDLKLGSHYVSRCHPDLCRAIGNLKRLEVLHLKRMSGMGDVVRQKEEIEDYQEGLLYEIVAAGIKLRELVVIGTAVYYEDINRAVHAFESTLEVLIVSEIRVGVDLQSPRFKYEHGFPKLTRLETELNENQETIQLLCSKLDHRLTHLGTIQDGRTLTDIANLKALRSVAIKKVNAEKLLPLWESFPENGGSSQIECLSLHYIEGYEQSHSHLMAVSLRKLWTSNSNSEFATGLLKSLVFSKLEILAVYCGDNEGVLAEVEEVMAARQGDFPERLQIHLLLANNKDIREGESDFKVIGNNVPGLHGSTSGLEQR